MGTPSKPATLLDPFHFSCIDGPAASADPPKMFRTPADERPYSKELVDGRRRSKNVMRETLKSKNIDVSNKTLDCAWMALTAGEDGATVLDVDRVSKGLCAGRTPQTGPHPHMSAIVVSPRVACTMHDVGRFEKYRATHPAESAAEAWDAVKDELARGDYTKLLAGGMRELEGHLVPWFGQIKPKVDAGEIKCRRGQHTDKDPPVDDKPHPQLFRPGVLLTVSDKERDKMGQGHILALCVYVSTRAFNYPEGHPDRVSFQTTAAFEESIAYMYVVRAYDPPFCFRALGPPGILGKRKSEEHKRLKAPEAGRNSYEHVFKWEAHIGACIATNPTDDFYNAAGHGFNDLKMSRESLRRFMPWSIADGHAHVVRLRDAGKLDDQLVMAPMGSSNKCKNGDFGGGCLRKALLTEMLLLNTPLAPLLRGSRDPDDFAGAFVATPVPGGPSGLHARMKEFFAANT